MQKEQTTKERILDVGQALILEKSFHSVGLKQILDAACVPKGSFYYYFKSKEDFGVELLRHYIAEAREKDLQTLCSYEVEPDPLKRFFGFLDKAIEIVETDPDKFPCLLLKLGTEVVDLSEPMRAELAQGFAVGIYLLQQILDEAVATKQLSCEVDTALEASLIHDLCAGATQRSIITRTSDPIKTAVAQIKIHIDRIRNT